MKLEFPKDFLWGAATSAHQVEGGNTWNDWWKFENETGIERSALSSDHYHLYEEDYKLAKNLNLNAIRFSIEWSRIHKGPGRFDDGEIAHYKDELLTLKRLGIKSMVTLHHFTNPVWFNELGSWDKNGNERYFLEFAAVCAKEFGSLVDFWCILNEPMTPYASLGFLTGFWPPQKKNFFAFLRANLNMIKAHNGSYTIIKGHSRAPVGTAFNVAPHFPNYFWEWPLVPITNYFRNWWYLDRIANYSDYMGVNYYFPLRFFKKIGPTDMGWEINFNGFYVALTRVWRRYKMPIYITENGAADNEDKIRWEYIKGHLEVMHKTIKEGADIRGYYHWSLLDNFEWTSGFGQRFGLIRIDYKTLKRTPNKSAYRYAAVAGSNFLED